MANLGKLYEDGAGVPKDRTEALRLYRAAAAAGNAFAKQQLARLGEAPD